MKLARINPFVVAAIGVVLAFGAVAAIFFLLIQPTQAAITVAQGRYDAAAPDAAPSAQKAAQQKLDDAKKQVQQTKQQWAQKEAAVMPPLDVSDRFKAFRQLTYEFSHYLGPNLQRQLKAGRVNSTTVFKLPPPPSSPNDITNAPIIIPLGSVTVTGDFRQILTHFYDWRFFNRLVLVSGLEFHGNSPYMTGKYNATMYIFPQNDDKLAKPIAQAGGAGAGAAGGPMGGPGMGAPGMGGPPGGMRPGGPPGAPPGR